MCLTRFLPVSPVWRARTKKRTAETLATDFSSSLSAERMSWKTRPTQWEMVETRLVRPRTETSVSEPVIRAVCGERNPAFSLTVSDLSVHRSHLSLMP